MYVAWGISGGAVVASPTSPKPTRAWAAPALMLMALVVMGGVPPPLVVVVVAAPNAIPTGPGLSAERHSGDTIKKVGTFVGTFSIAIIQS